MKTYFWYLIKITESTLLLNHHSFCRNSFSFGPELYIIFLRSFFFQLQFFLGGDTKFIITLKQRLLCCLSSYDSHFGKPCKFYHRRIFVFLLVKLFLHTMRENKNFTQSNDSLSVRAPRPNKSERLRVILP